jgi:hypothetical protein
MVVDRSNNLAPSRSTLLERGHTLHRGKLPLKLVSTPHHEMCLDNCLPPHTVPSCQWKIV